jgi:hypothetical protein
MATYVQQCNATMTRFGGKLLAANPNFGRDGTAANLTVDIVEGWWSPQYMEVGGCGCASNCAAIAACLRRVTLCLSDFNVDQCRAFLQLVQLD